MQWRTAAGKKMFASSSQMGKVIRMVYLGVIATLKGAAEMPEAEAVDLIHIASRTLLFIEPSLRKNWPKSADDAANITFLKLPAKLSNVEISLAIRFEALSFYALFIEKNNIQPELVTQYSQCLADVGSLADVEKLVEGLMVSLPLFCVSQRHVKFYSTNHISYNYLKTQSNLSICKYWTCAFPPNNIINPPSITPWSNALQLL
jgi:hypothetical protein